MASIYDLKPAFQNRLRPLTGALAGAGVTANQVTLLAALLSAVAGLWLALQPDEALPLLCLPVVLFIRMALNAIDGMLAREHHMQSKLGAVLNELGDVIADSLLYLPMALVPGVPAMLIVLIVLLSVLTEMAGVVAIQIGASRRYDGPMGKSDRAFFFGALGLALGLGLTPGPWVTVICTLVLLALALTVLNRARRALAEAT
jgi:CDP-diacylglycerol--glycerol-3-phosphate 3-phosphatidyltransferase